MRKLLARPTGFSSVVGGGITLVDEHGRAAFMVNFIGTTEGITKQESAELSDQFARFVNERGITVSDRPKSPR